jgi:hypothetical protein
MADAIKYYDDRKWSLYFKCIIALALALTLAFALDLAIVINYDHKWCSKITLMASLTDYSKGVIYKCNMF